MFGDEGTTATDSELLDHFLRVHRTDDFLPRECPLCAEIQRRLEVLEQQANPNG